MSILYILASCVFNPSLISEQRQKLVLQGRLSLSKCLPGYFVFDMPTCSLNLVSWFLVQYFITHSYIIFPSGMTVRWGENKNKKILYSKIFIVCIRNFWTVEKVNTCPKEIAHFQASEILKTGKWYEGELLRGRFWQ